MYLLFINKSRSNFLLFSTRIYLVKGENVMVKIFAAVLITAVVMIVVFQFIDPNVSNPVIGGNASTTLVSGNGNSISEEFIKAASPSEAIISCGEKNKYGHPNKEVIDRLNKYNVKIRRTDKEGTISYVSMFA